MKKKMQTSELDKPTRDGAVKEKGSRTSGSSIPEGLEANEETKKKPRIDQPTNAGSESVSPTKILLDDQAEISIVYPMLLNGVRDAGC